MLDHVCSGISDGYGGFGIFFLRSLGLQWWSSGGEDGWYLVQNLLLRCNVGGALQDLEGSCGVVVFQGLKDASDVLLVSGRFVLLCGFVLCWRFDCGPQAVPFACSGFL